MHIIRPLTGQFTVGPVVLESQTDYLVEDVNAGEFLAVSERAMRVSPWSSYRRSSSISQRGVLIVLPGGFGDLLFLGPVVHALRARDPDMPIGISCFSPAACVVAHWGVERVEILPYPLPVDATHQYALIVPLEMLVQRNPGMHTVDLFASAVGIDIPVDDRACRWVATSEELAGALAVGGPLPVGFKRRVGMQLMASAMLRTWPADKQLEFIALATARKWQVLLFGGPGECNLQSSPEVINLTQCEGLTFADSAAIMHLCDGFVAPDSSLCHLAGAIGIPTVALYGPFAWQERTMYHRTVHGINGQAPCAPCRHHVRALANNDWPAHGPCVKTQQCEAMRDIDPARVIALLDRQMMSNPSFLNKA